MDYPNKARIKIWGEAEVVDNVADFEEILPDSDYRARVERIIKIKITAWDINCPQHIQQRFTVEEFQPYIDRLQQRIEELEAQLEG